MKSKTGTIDNNAVDRRTDDVNMSFLLAHFLDLKKQIVKSATVDIIAYGIKAVERKIFILSHNVQSTKVSRYETRTDIFRKIYEVNTYRKAR